MLISSIHRWAGTSYLPELNKGTLVYSQAEGQGRSGKPLNTIIIIKASQKKFPTWSQNWLPPCKITFTQFSEIILCLQCFLLFFFLINNQLNRHILGRNFAFPHISQCEIFKAFLQPIAWCKGSNCFMHQERFSFNLTLWSCSQRNTPIYCCSLFQRVFLNLLIYVILTDIWALRF